MNLSKLVTRGFCSILLCMIPSSSQFLENMWKMDTCGPPQIQNTMMNQTKYPGEPAYFKCQIDMSKCMVAFIDWYYIRINGSEREKIKSARRGDPHTHVIQSVDQDHEGLYTCVVGNVLGQAEASAYLSVTSGSSQQMSYQGLWCCLLVVLSVHQAIRLILAGHRVGVVAGQV
eukprot:TRINITY_DN14063_c0_g1_i1.p1 TRINITY_DN14063_c0_g1~~TRINITY_DN14063_c0_g1_i1.p1  ORF type:complete len:173 (-),score=31.25 TRINITY_DN14063_c0_g1_i1:625-1143(-)